MNPAAWNNFLLTLFSLRTSCLADLEDQQDEEQRPNNVETSRQKANSIQKNKQALERDSTLLSIVTRGIEPTADSLSQNSDDSSVSGLSPLISEFIKSEKGNSSANSLDFRRESVIDFGQLNFGDDSDREEEAHEIHSNKSQAGLSKELRNKKFSIYSTLCNLV